MTFEEKADLMQRQEERKKDLKQNYSYKKIKLMKLKR